MKYGIAIAVIAGMLAGSVERYWPAQAAQLSVTGPRGSTFYTYNGEPRPAVTFAPDLRTPEERDAREAAWWARCRPIKSAPNELGVQHYIYAAKGCEYGD